MIEVKNLFFEYPGKLALEDVSFDIARGEIAALVGPNGAGKTTLLRSLAALDKPVSGGIIVDGINVILEPRRCHEQVGYLADFFGLYENLTVKQCLLYMARAHNLPAAEEHHAVVRAAKRLHIEDRLDQAAGTLSRGLSQRLAIAQAIIHEPAILMLDEPASGLDPEARSQLSHLFRELSAQGITLIVSSHILAELEEYCTSMLVVRDGKIIEHRGIHSEISDRVTMQLALSHPFEDLHAVLEMQPDTSQIEADELSANFEFCAESDSQAALLTELINLGVPVYRFTERKTSLQDAYLAHISELEETA